MNQPNPTLQLQRVAIAPDQRHDSAIQLTTAQQHYLCRVLRLQNGDRFIAMDGQCWWLAILEDGARATAVEAIAADTELPIPVTLLIAMPKQGMDDIVRQATELGVSAIMPVISDRTVLNPSPKKLERWQRIVQEAAEQSERQHFPSVADPCAVTAALDYEPDALKLWCMARGDRPLLLPYLQSCLHTPTRPLRMVLAIGPEGGWTMAETRQATERGYQAVSLGRRVLRSVTAPIAALGIIATVLESTWNNASNEAEGKQKL
jgi:16S rRNA (uracil1498-N3)-methyltransferase